MFSETQEISSYSETVDLIVFHFLIKAKSLSANTIEIGILNRISGNDSAGLGKKYSLHCCQKSV